MCEVVEFAETIFSTKIKYFTAGDTQSSEQALTLLSESGPTFVSKVGHYPKEPWRSGLCVSPSVIGECWPC